MADDDRTVIAGVGGRVPVGTRLNGIYQIDALVGSGGMSEIYRGHNVQTFDKVAIKVILPQYANDEQIVSLFRREALILNRLSHEAIIRYHVFSHDPAIDLLYLAMEFVEGPTLRERMAQRPLSQLEACRLIAKVAAGMRAAHNEGIIHRDLSSDNIILSGGDVARPKVIDFGIARAGEANDSTLIESGFAGKYNYVSPEQLGLFGGSVGPAADIYSLGLVFAAALRGKPLDMSGTHADVILKRQSLPDLSQINPGVKPLIERMLQPNPAQRIKSMEEVQTSLEAVLGPARDQATGRMPRLAGSAPLPSRAKPRRWPWVAALLMLAGLGAAGWTLTQQGMIDPEKLLARLQPATGGKTETPPTSETGKSQTRAPAEGVAAAGDSTTEATPETAAGSEDAPAKNETRQQPAEPSEAQVATTEQEQDQVEADDEAAPAAAPPGTPDTSTTEPSAGTASEQSPASSSPRVSLNEQGPTADPETSAAPAANMPLPINEWLRRFDGGDCFYVRPVQVAASSARIEGFTQTVEPLEKLEKSFNADFGFDPVIGMRPVQESQCPILKLVEQGSGAMRVDLKRDLIEAKGALEASVSGLSSRHVALFLAAPDGSIRNVTNQAQESGGEIAIDVPAEGIKANKLGYLMLVVGADKPLAALEVMQFKTSSAFVGTIEKQAEEASSKLDAAVVYFRRE